MTQNFFYTIVPPSDKPNAPFYIGNKLHFTGILVFALPDQRRETQTFIRFSLHDFTLSAAADD